MSASDDAVDMLLALFAVSEVGAVVEQSTDEKLRVTFGEFLSRLAQLRTESGRLDG